MNNIHSTAIVSNDAQLGNNVHIGPYAIIEGNTKIADGCHIDSHAIIRSGTTLDGNVRVDSHSVIGGPPQHLKFDNNTNSYVQVGENTIIREHVTIHRSIEENGKTIVGKECFLMGSSHIGHDCILGHNCTIAQGALIGGHVEMGNHIFVGGGSGIHQFTRIGNGVMIGAISTITRDIPPHLTAAERNQLAGLNLVGLRRRNTHIDAIGDLKRLYTMLLTKSMNPAKLVDKAKEAGLGTTEIGKEFLEFFSIRNRKYCRPKKRYFPTDEES